MTAGPGAGAARSVGLPLDYGPLIGRSAEERRAVALLARHRLVTLTGTGGVGKTRLAIRIANSLAESVGGGAWMVELAALPQTATVDDLWASIARTVRLFTQQSGLEVVASHLGSQNTLLVLDNCEHITPPVREAVPALLAATPTLRILTTSRQPLHLPEAGEQVVDLEPLSTQDAVETFLTYAHAGDGALTGAAGTPSRHSGSSPSDLRQITRLVEAVDRLPLALELTSRWVATMGVDELFAAVTADPWQTVVDIEPGGGRHSTLQHIYDWSWRLCSEEEQIVWQWISLFPKAATQQVIVDVCAGSGLDRLTIARAVAGLRDKRILASDVTRSGPPRLGLLATARQYGLEKLEASGQMNTARAAYCAHYRAMLAHAATAWPSPDEVTILQEINDQVDHIKAAIDYCLADKDLTSARAMVIDITRTRPGFLCGWLGDNREMADHVLRAGGPETVTSGDEARHLADLMAADAWVTVTQGYPDRAFELIGAAHDLLARWGQDPTPWLQFAEGGTLALARADARAIPLLAGARDAFGVDTSMLGDRLMATLMWSIALTASGAADDATAAARTYLREAHQSGSPWTESWAYWANGFVALTQGQRDEAAEHCRQALVLQSGMDDVWGLTWSLLLAAAIAAETIGDEHPDRRQAERAAWLAAAAEKRRTNIGVRVEGLAPLATVHDQVIDRVAAVLDARTLKRRLDEGRRRHQHAVEYAMGRRLPPLTDDLTERQLDVARLMLPDHRGHQRSDREIADELNLGVRTVEHHVGNILRILGLDGRDQLTADHLAATNREPRDRDRA